jgi:hypothetical protein
MRRIGRSRQTGNKKMNTRLRREEPERMGPIRAWETLFRPSGDRSQPVNRESSDRESGEHELANEESSGPPGAEESASPGRDKSPWNDIASRAIERGYQVIEEQINEGRRIAERFRGYSDDVRKVNDDTSRLIERSLRFYTDVGYLWFELMESILRREALRAESQAATNGAARGESQPHDGNGTGNGSAQSRRNGVEIEVISASPTSVALDLQSAPDDALAVSPLHAADERNAPLTDVRFRKGENGTVLRIKIPPGQPADTYSGVVVDGRSHQPKGTLCVNVRTDETAP